MQPIWTAPMLSEYPGPQSNRRRVSAKRKMPIQMAANEISPLATTPLRCMVCMAQKKANRILLNGDWSSARGKWMRLLLLVLRSFDVRMFRSIAFSPYLIWTLCLLPGKSLGARRAVFSMPYLALRWTDSVRTQFFFWIKRKKRWI